MKHFKDIREKFNQKVPSGKRLTDMEMFLDAKDIEKALKILTTELKKAKITFNKKMKNIKRSDMGTGDVAINAIDEGDRWRLIVMKNAPDMKNRKEIDLTSAFMAIQKLPSAKFKNMYAEGVDERRYGKSMSRKDLLRKYGNEMKKALKSNSLELSDKAEEDLIQYVMDNYPEEIRTDDPDDWVEWLDDNLEDFVKGKGYK